VNFLRLFSIYKEVCVSPLHSIHLASYFWQLFVPICRLFLSSVSFVFVIQSEAKDLVNISRSGYYRDFSDKSSITRLPPYGRLDDSRRQGE